MDRSMKVMFGMMTTAICLIALTLTGNQTPQAYAGEYIGAGDRGTEPTIVWFGVSNDTGQGRIIYSRLWSDGSLQYRLVRNNPNSCDNVDQDGCGWIDVSPPAGGDGVACGADLNNDSVVNIYDLMVVLDKWGSNTVCEPTYECIDLNNLPSGMGG